jgi:hypothetical protein
MITMHARRSLTLACWLPLALAACPTTPPDPAAGTETGTTSATTEAATTSPGVTSTSGASITTGADTSGSGSSGSGSSDTGTFIMKPDGCFAGDPELGWSSHCIQIVCDVGLQDCPRGEKCMPWANDGGDAWNSNRCVALMPDPVAPGGTCTVEGSAVSGIDDCEEGSMCWGVDPETLQGTCIELCNARRFPSTTCVEPTECIALNEASVPVCLSPCNPLQPAACPDGEACRYLEGDVGFRCLPLLGGHVQGSSQHCDDATCSPSQLCVLAELLGTCETASCCTELCDLGDPGADALCAAIDPLLACEPFYEPGGAPVGLELVGVCSVPM